jgi:hypothetical protein
MSVALNIHKLSDSLVVAAGELEMHGPYLRLERSRSRGLLLGRSTPVINQVSFHRRHPPMARLNETQRLRVAEPELSTYHCSAH